MKKTAYEHIATPNEIPNSISDESRLQEAMRTTSLREFAAQTKDLSARLSVQLRRNAELEAHIAKLGSKIASLKDQNEEISNNSLKNRQLALLHQEELDKANERLKQTEIELGQLNILYRDLKITHEQRLTKTDRQVKRFERYRKRINQYIRPRLNQLVEQNFSLLKQFRDIQIENSAHKEQLEVTKYVLDREKNKTKSKVSQAADLQDEIIASYEVELKNLQQLVDQRNIELTKAEQKRRYLEGIRDKYVVMENRAIAADRVRFEMERTYDEKISELRQSLIEIKENFKSQQKDFAAQNKMLEILRDENEELTNKYLNSATKASASQGENQANFVKISQTKAKNIKLERQVDEKQTALDAVKRENAELRQELKKLQSKPKLPTAMPKDLEIFEESPEKESSKAKNKVDDISPVKWAEDLKLADYEFSEMQEIDRLIKEIETGYPIKVKEKEL